MDGYLGKCPWRRQECGNSEWLMGTGCQCITVGEVTQVNGGGSMLLLYEGGEGC